MIQSYKKKPIVEPQYDSIIIGSGMSGLTTAAILAKQGKKVLVLERHYTAGGFTHVFKRPGYEWDVGIHYVGDMGKETGFSRKLSDYITNGSLKWADMGEVYDRVVIGDTSYDFPKGKINLIALLKSKFPNDHIAIDKYFEKVDQAVKANRGFFMNKAAPLLISKLFGWFILRKFNVFAHKTTLEVLNDITKNTALIKVLTAQYGDYGLPPAESSFVMHAWLVKHYFNGGYFPEGGSSQIAKTIEKVIEKEGGTVLINAEVEHIIIKDKKAVGVQMIDGREFMADSIISGVGIHTTLTKLLPPSCALHQELSQNMTRIKPSMAHSCLYVGLNGLPKELNLPKANYWIYPKDGSHEENIRAFKNDIDAALPLVYISFPAAKDPSWATRYPGKSTIDIITIMPYSIFEKWENTDWKKRGEEYEAMKETIALRLLEKLYEQEPQLKGKVDFYELSTPLTTQKFVNYAKGEIYGLEHTPERFVNKSLRPETSLKNFYLTGQDIVTAGVVGAMASGLLTASSIMKENLIKKIFKN